MLAVFNEEEHRYFDKSGKEYPSVSSILTQFGISNIDTISRFVNPDTMQRSRDFGKELHRTAMLDDQDFLKSCDSKIEPYLIGWRQFIADVKPKFIAYEQPLLSKEWGFAGTPDRVEDRGTFLNIPDIKTGAVTVAEEIQTALYAILVEEHYKKRISARYSVHVKPFGYEIVRHYDKGDIGIAKCLLTIMRYKKRKGL